MRRVVATVTLAALIMVIGSRRVPGFAGWRQAPTADMPVYGYEIVRVYPHDPRAFTQGLRTEPPSPSWQEPGGLRSVSLPMRK